MATVRAAGLRKIYGETVALRDVSLAIDAGTVFGLLGPNGAGKTTLIRCLTGTTVPDAGRAELLGEPPGAIDRRRIGVLPQAFRPADRLTARELVAHYAGLYDHARPVSETLEAVGLAGAADTRYGALSGGQQRRVCVGLAIVNEPEVLILDEPTTGIDPAGRQAVWSLIERLATAGTTVLLTTHYTEEAERLADRVGILVDGRLVDDGPPETLVERHGGPPRLVVASEASPDDVADRLADHDVTRRDGELVIDGVEPAAVSETIDAIEAAGITYERLTWRRPDLETVYLELADGTDAPSTPAPIGDAEGNA